MISYGNAVNFLTFAYHQLNGEINPSIPAVNLALTECGDIRDSGVMGAQTMLTVEVRLKNMFDQFANTGLTDRQFKGVLLYVLAHELSHCDQKKEPMKLLANDQEYIDYMEYTNDINTLRYLREHEKSLQSYLGPYELHPIVYNRFNKLKTKFNDKFIEFPQISSIKETILDGVSFLMNEDVYNTIYPTVNNINLSLYVTSTPFNPFISFKIIREKNLICGKEDIFKLSQLIARGIFDYKRTSKINGDTCNMYLYLDYN